MTLLTLRLPAHVYATAAVCVLFCETDNTVLRLTSLSCPFSPIFQSTLPPCPAPFCTHLWTKWNAVSSSQESTVHAVLQGGCTRLHSHQQRERERERESVCVSGGVCVCVPFSSAHSPEFVTCGLFDDVHSGQRGWL